MTKLVGTCASMRMLSARIFGYILKPAYPRAIETSTRVPISELKNLTLLKLVCLPGYNNHHHHHFIYSIHIVIISAPVCSPRVAYVSVVVQLCATV